MSDEYEDRKPQQIADLIADRLAVAIDERGTASLVVCGGQSPRDVFTCLSNKELAWRDVRVTLTDDRHVSSEDPRSNIKLVSEQLLIGRAMQATFLSLQDLDSVNLMPFDVVLLGLGLDGHIASLFPDMLGDPDAFSPCASPQILYTKAKGSPFVPRVSMNLSMLLRCNSLLLLVKGKEKKALIEDLRAMPTYAKQQYPVGMLFKHCTTTVHLCVLN